MEVLFNMCNMVRRIPAHSIQQKHVCSIAARKRWDLWRHMQPSAQPDHAPIKPREILLKSNGYCSFTLAGRVADMEHKLISYFCISITNDSIWQHLKLFLQPYKHRTSRHSHRPNSHFNSVIRHLVSFISSRWDGARSFVVLCAPPAAKRTYNYSNSRKVK
jgi:hypothetical protein